MVWDFIQNKAISWDCNVVLLQLNGVSDSPKIYLLTTYFFYKVILFTDTLLVQLGKLSIWDVPSSLYLLVLDNMEASFIQLLPRLEIPKVDDNHTLPTSRAKCDISILSPNYTDNVLEYFEHGL